MAEEKSRTDNEDTGTAIPSAPATDYPEHRKLSAISDKSQAIYDFLEWVGETHGAELAVEAREGTDRLWPLRKSRRDLLAEFFEIDMNKIDDEKRAMLDALRKANEK